MPWCGENLGFLEEWVARGKTGKKELLSGNAALARGAYEAGVKVACAYPGTPSTEILETLAGFPEVDAQWSVNEKVALEVALGAAVGGVRSLYASKHVGLNVAMDPLMTSAYVGVSAGLVVVVCDDPGMHSSQNEQDTRWVALYGKLPLLEPSSPAEAHLFVQEAYRISERYDTPVLVRLTTRVAHAKEDVTTGGRREVAPKSFNIDAAKYVMVPRNGMRRHAVLEQRLEKLRRYAEQTAVNRIEEGDNTLGIVVSGVAYLYAREAYPDASFLKLGMPHPLPERLLRDFAGRVERLVVIEELDPFLEEGVRAMGLDVERRHVSWRVGELRPEDIPLIVKRRPRPRRDRAGARRPVMCAGCPHRFVFWILRKNKVTVAGDIGCYTLAAAPPLAALHTCVCMGAGVTFQEGLRRAQPGERFVGVVGDSTFVHSGITGLINAVYNRIDGVILILDNATTAMTGMQDNPATGTNIRGEPTRRLDLEELCRACGVESVDVIDPEDLESLEETLKRRLDEKGLSVIITRRPCWQLVRTRRPIPEYLREKCRKCGICLQIDCPALSEDEEGFIKLDEDICVGCDLCVKVCPFDALVSRWKEEAGEHS